MKKNNYYILLRFLLIFVVMQFTSCDKISEINQEPELESLQQGLKTSVAIGYCASIVVSAATGKQLPDNVTVNQQTGLIYIKIDNNHPLPFNKNVGDIIIAYLWNNNSGIMTILFSKIDILGGNIKLFGIYTVPVIARNATEGIDVVYAKQDILIGNGSDTILNMGNITDFYYNSELERLNTEKPTDAFVAVKQNFWFVNIDQNNTYSNVYDDNITINGGGQIAEAYGSSGGVIYHAMINTKVNYAACNQNPISGNALLQNFKIGGAPLIDLGNYLLSFNNNCDGKAHVDISTGKYLNFFGKDISLNLE